LKRLFLCSLGPGTLAIRRRHPSASIISFEFRATPGPANLRSSLRRPPEAHPRPRSHPEADRGNTGGFGVMS